MLRFTAKPYHFDRVYDRVYDRVLLTLSLRFADTRRRRNRPPAKEIARLCAEIQRYLNKRFEDAGTCSPMKTKNVNDPDVYFRAWSRAPQEFLFYNQAVEIRDALRDRWHSRTEE